MKKFVENLPRSATILFVAYNFGWSYSPSAIMPTNVSINCSWGDGVNQTGIDFPLTIVPFSNASFKLFNVTHDYTAAGRYYQECNMFNMISNQTLTNNVSKRSNGG